MYWKVKERGEEWIGSLSVVKKLILSTNLQNGLFEVCPEIGTEDEAVEFEVEEGEVN